MPRFKWNDPAQGRALNRYIDTMCKNFPLIARDVVKHGIGDLNYWFQQGKDSDRTATVAQARCGCLVGTTCLVAMDRYKSVGAKVKAGLDDTDEKQDAPMILYKMIVAKTRRNISRYKTALHSSCIESGYDEETKALNKDYDPLLVCILQAGIAAQDEAGIDTYDYSDGWARRAEQRHRQVVDRLEWRIRQRLGLLPRKRVAAK